MQKLSVQTPGRSVGQRLAAHLAVACILATALSAFAQIGPPAQRAIDNVSGGAIRLMAPGNMVSAGVGRMSEFRDQAQAPIEIVETERPVSLRAQTLSAAIEIVFEQINEALVLLHNLILVRAGRDPQLPGTTAATGKVDSARMIDTAPRTAGSLSTRQPVVRR